MTNFVDVAEMLDEDNQYLTRAMRLIGKQVSDTAFSQFVRYKNKAADRMLPLCYDRREGYPVQIYGHQRTDFGPLFSDAESLHNMLVAENVIDYR